LKKPVTEPKQLVRRSLGKAEAKTQKAAFQKTSAHRYLFCEMLSLFLAQIASGARSHFHSTLKFLPLKKTSPPFANIQRGEVFYVSFFKSWIAGNTRANNPSGSDV
jgi:hypothetical protein